MLRGGIVSLPIARSGLETDDIAFEHVTSWLDDLRAHADENVSIIRMSEPFGGCSSCSGSEQNRFMLRYSTPITRYRLRPSCSSFQHRTGRDNTVTCPIISYFNRYRSSAKSGHTTRRSFVCKTAWVALCRNISERGMARCRCF